jgi:hypothetical protein
LLSLAGKNGSGSGDKIELLIGSEAGYCDIGVVRGEEKKSLLKTGPGLNIAKNIELRNYMRLMRTYIQSNI